MGSQTSVRDPLYWNTLSGEHLKTSEFKLEDSEFIMLCDLLKTLGLCQTGGHAKMVISEGEVKVDNAVELRKRAKIRVGQVIEFDGQQIKIIS